MTTKQQVLQKLAEGMTIESAVEAVVPGADVAMWKKAIHWQAGNRQRPATRLERGHVPKRRKRVPERVLWKRNSLEGIK